MRAALRQSGCLSERQDGSRKQKSEACCGLALFACNACVCLSLIFVVIVTAGYRLSAAR